MALLGVYKAGVSVALGLVLVYSLQSYFGGFYGTFVDISIDLLAAAAVLFASLAMLKYGRGVGTQSGRIWPAFMLGLLMWFLGEVSFSIYFDVLGVSVPYPSLADVFYLGGYIPLFVGLYLYVRYFASLFTREVLAVAAIAVVLVGILVTVLLIDPVMTETADPLARFFDFAYPFLDLILFALSVLGLSVVAGGKIAPAWIFLNVAVLLNVVADMLFSYMTAIESYYVGSFPDLLYMFGYLSFALAFYLHRREL